MKSKRKQARIFIFYLLLCFMMHHQINKFSLQFILIFNFSATNLALLGRREGGWCHIHSLSQKSSVSHANEKCVSGKLKKFLIYSFLFLIFKMPIHKNEIINISIKWKIYFLLHKFLLLNLKYLRFITSQMLVIGRLDLNTCGFQ